MRLRTQAVVALAALLVLALFAGPAAAQQEIPEELLDDLTEDAPDEIPEGMDLEEFIETYVLDEVEGVVIDAEEPAESEDDPDVAVLGVTQERLPVTGGDLLSLAAIGLVLTGLGFLAVRRGRSRPTPEQG